MSRDSAPTQSVRFDHVVAAVQNHDFDTARSLLNHLEADFPLDEDVFMWKAGVARTPAEAVKALERVLSLNPKNDRAVRTLTMVRAYGFEAAAESLSMSGTLLACKVCGLKHAKPFQHCSACGSLADISNLNGMLNNRRVIGRFLHQVVEDLEKRRSPDAAFAAAMGRLNLGQLPEAVAQFERSRESWPSEARFRIWLEKLDSCRIVLAIDDSKIVLQAIESVLGRRGITVRTAHDGVEALRIIEGIRPEAIFLDNTIAGVAEARKDIRRQADLAEVPFIVMSASVLDRMKAKLGGAAAVLAKPFDTAALLSALAETVDFERRPPARSWLRVRPPAPAESPVTSRPGIAVRAAAGRSRLR